MNQISEIVWDNWCENASPLRSLVLGCCYLYAACLDPPVIFQS